MFTINKSLSLRRRIYSMSFMLVGMCLFTTLVGFLGQSSLLRSFAEYEDAERTLAKFASLDRDIERLKSRTNSYLNTGSESQLDAALVIQSELVDRIEELKDRENATELSDTIDQMSGSLEIFQTQLKRASSERSLRRQLVMEDLPAQEKAVRLDLIQLGKLIQPMAQEFPMINDQFFAAQRNYHIATESLQQYFIDPDATAFDTAVFSIRQCQINVREITNELNTPESSDLGNRLDSQLLEMKQLGSRAVQATRGYMYYIDVVMAGELSEFVYFSNRLQSLTESRRIASQLTQRQSASRARMSGLFASLIAAGLAVYMATRLSYSIVAPISKITEVFRQLGQGTTVDVIPALDRHDEIGRMARAAKVFNDKNRETTELLQHSQRLTEELADKAGDLEKTNQELDNFAYVASHDLKSPLRGISHLAGWIQDDCGDLLPPSSQAHLTQMQGRVERMNLLLDELLDYSRAGRVLPQSETVDLESLVAELLLIVDRPDDFRIFLNCPTFKFDTCVAPLKQVLRNLLHNSVKYSHRGAEAFVEIFAEIRGEVVFFSIKDNGPGIDPAFHDKVFEMYQRLDSDADGSGMGLAIVKKLVESHDGEISLLSEQGGGADFQFTWPIIELGTPSKTVDDSSSAIA